MTPDFVHRKNPNGSFDSICLLCYRTVSNELYEDELSDAESVHACHLSGPEMFSDFQRPPGKLISMPIRNGREHSQG